MRSYLLALSFLTVLPIKINYMATEKQMENTMYFYPLVGLTLGVIMAIVSYLTYILDLGIAGDTLTILILLVITGGLHMDGLMDTADGIMSGKDRETKLEIMKDSRSGAMGVMACIFIIILKITLLSELVYPQKLLVLLLAPAVGRWSFVYGITTYPYARKKPGLGSIYGKDHKSTVKILTTLILAIISFLLLKWQGLIITLTILFVVIIDKFLAKMLGGMTGDTYGATGELAEMWVLFIAVVLSKVV